MKEVKTLSWWDLLLLIPVGFAIFMSIAIWQIYPSVEANLPFWIILVSMFGAIAYVTVTDTKTETR